MQFSELLVSISELLIMITTKSKQIQNIHRSKIHFLIISKCRLQYCYTCWNVKNADVPDLKLSL